MYTGRMSPYSGRTDLPPARSKTGHKFAWARLNSDALFVALLAFGAGVFDLLDPYGDPTVQEIGHPTASYYLRAIAFVVAGLMIMVSLVREHVSTEIVGRTVLTTAIGFDLLRTVGLFGWNSSETVGNIVLFAIIFATSSLRISVLLSKKGLVVRLPERDNDGYHSPEDDVPTHEGPLS